MPSIDVLLAAPSEPSALTNWGDYHFGRALMDALRAEGVDARMLFRDGSAGGGQTAVYRRTLLVLRGKFRPSADWLLSSGYSLRLLWVISWPLDLSQDELALYDLIFVASIQDLPRIARLSGKPTLFLPQATAFQSFQPAPASDGKLLFIGNTRGLHRPIVQAFAREDLPLSVIGQGWHEQGLRPEAGSIANDQLPERYRRALAVLNDHHGAMRDYGYMNNRIYDALACGVPVISDMAPDCPDDLMPAVILHRPGRDDPAETLEAVTALRRQSTLLHSVARRVRRKHSFSARAHTLLHALAELRINTASSAPTEKAGG